MKHDNITTGHRCKDTTKVMDTSTIIDITDIVQQFKSEYYTPRQIALLRIRLLLPDSTYTTRNTGTRETKNARDTTIVGPDEQEDVTNYSHRIGGLAAIFVPAMTMAAHHFIQSCDRAHSDPIADMNFADPLSRLHRFLSIYLRWVTIDSTLGEELSRQGAHSPLIQLLKLTTVPSPPHLNNNDHVTTLKFINDGIENILDMAGQIAVAGRSHFPTITHPFTINELQQRLPLTMTFYSYNDRHHNVPATPITILIHQICSRQSAQVDVGFVLWPSAVVLSSFIVKKSLQNDLIMKQSSCTTSVLELGAGCGLSGLVAAACLRKVTSQSVNVILTDFNSLVLENLRQNVNLNNVSDICSVIDLDFYKQSGKAAQYWVSAVDVPCGQVDVVIAADIICQPSDASAVANTIHDVLKPNGVAYIVCADAKHRYGVDHIYEECQRVGLTISMEDLQLQEDDGFKRNLEATTGYVHGMKFKLFFIKK